MQKIGIYGGTFSPPHNGHLAAVRAFRDELGLDTVYLIPTFVPPHKRAEAADEPTTRLALLELAVAGEEQLAVSDFEIAKADVSYTVDTLRAFSAPDRELYFLCGTDMFLTLPIWKDVRDIFALSTIVCMRREADAELALQVEEARADYETTYGARVRFLTTPHIEISSSRIRKWIAAGDVRAADYLPAAVYEHIKTHSLYQTKEPLTAFVESRLDGYRLAHTYAVAEECARLANLFALSFADRARLHTAAMLHDVTKQENTEGQIALLAAYGETPTAEELASPKTLHGRTAALVAAHQCPNLVDAGICHAIAVHTTGGTEMSLFDWLLYLADYIEPTRTFADCVTLRNFFYNGIHAGRPRMKHLYDTIVRSFTMTVEGLCAESAPIHPTTLAVFDALRAHPEAFPCVQINDGSGDCSFSSPH